MTRLEHLTQFSNAVLSPELNACEYLMKKGGSGHAVYFSNKHSKLKTDEIAFRKAWCEQQADLIGEFGAVIEVVA